MSKNKLSFTSKTNEVKNNILKGSIILVFAGLLGKILGAVYRIPLSNILSAEGIGIYQMIFPIFSLALIICSGGVSVTVAHYVAKIRASGKGSVKKVFFKGFFYTLITSVLFGLLLFFLGDYIARLQGNILASAGYKMVAVALIFSSILASFRGVFQGYQNMLPTAISQVLEQIFKVIFGLFFAYFFVGESIELGVFGAFLGIAIAEIFAFVYLLLTYKKNKLEDGNGEIFNSKFLTTNFFITLGVIIIPLISTLDSFIVVNLLKNFYNEKIATSLYGLQSGMINSLINFPVIISVGVSLALLPDLSFMLSQNNRKMARQKVSNIFGLLLLILAPCCLIFIFFASDVMAFLYPTLDTSLVVTASKLLQISAFQILFISILQISSTIFQSLDKPKIPIYILIISGIIKVIFTIYMVSLPNITIFGLAFANFIFYAFAGIVSLMFVKKYLDFQVDLKLLFYGIPIILLFGCSCIFINVYFSTFWVKMFFVGLSGLLFYILPILSLNLLGLKTFIKAKISHKSGNEEIENE